MKTKFYWVALLASAALIGQAQAGDPHGGGFGGRSFNGGGHAVGGASGLDQLEVEAVSVAVASTQQPRRWVVRPDPLEWERAEAACWLRHTALLFS